MPNSIIDYKLLCKKDIKIDTFKLKYEVGLISFKKEILDTKISQILNFYLSINLSCEQTDFKNVNLIIESANIIFRENEYIIINFISPCKTKRNHNKNIITESNYFVNIVTDKNFGIFDTSHCK